MPNCFTRTIERRRPILPRLSQGIFVAGFLLSATAPARADDTNLVNEVKQLREQNAQLQQQLKQQGEQINALSRQFKDLQAAQPAGGGGEKPEGYKNSVLNKVIIGGEGGVGY